MSIMLVSKATSKVTVDGEEIKGLQTLEFKVKRRQTDIEGVGLGERIGVESGLFIVNGTLRVRSLSKKLDDLLYKAVSVPFNMVAELRKGDQLIKKITFDECFLDDKSLELGIDDVATTIYTFTSTRVREE
jgi:hypothetical protein